MLIDGVNVKDYTFDALYDRLGYVTQKAVLFAGTVQDNVFFGESAVPETDEVLSDALSLSQAAEFVGKYPEGAEHPIAQLGRNVSGGQKQRLSIARALARKPEILVFDDSFSALDYRTDAALRIRRRSSSPSASAPSATRIRSSCSTAARPWVSGRTTS